ncbi:MAG: ribonuclease H-like domain-containing protein [Anaerolineales bacterium]
MSEQSKQDLRRRLSHLGRRPIDKRDRPELSARHQQSIDELNGDVLTTAAGEAYRIERSYPLDYEHGGSTLLDLLRYDGRQLTAQVAQNEGLLQAPLADLAYVDTETTGLAGGAGTLVFLVGVGRFVNDAFVLHQYFLRDPAEEAGMLQALRDDLEASAGFVTFNGRAFDIPLLEMRYVMGARESWPLTSWPHLDLLHPARRLWRRQLPDCRLSTLEARVLGIERTEADVPGAEIPQMYLEYLQTGDVSQISRVVYHNEIDILSLVGLATEILSRHGEEDPSSLSSSEALAIARWHERAGRVEPAEAAYQVAADAAQRDSVRLEALRRWSTQLKRQGRFSEAVEAWQAWHAGAPDDVRPCIELAKHYEWKVKNLSEASKWAHAGLVCLSHLPDDWHRQRRWLELEHRLRRLNKKIDRDEQGG